MKIGTDYVGAPVGVSGSMQSGAAEDFAAAMAAAQAAQAQAAGQEEAKRPPSEAERIAAAREARENQVRELVEFLEKPLAVHLREAVMKELGLSEEKLAAMPPAERLATESMIAQKVRERLLERKDEGERSTLDQAVLPGGAAVTTGEADVQFSAERLASIMANSFALAGGQA